MKMSRIDYSVAELPIEEFAALDPEYWDASADPLYETYMPITEASKRHVRKKTELKDGHIYKFNFFLKRHAKRPGIVLRIEGEKPVICIIAGTEEEKGHDKYNANVLIQLPLKSGVLDKPSHVATNRFRYLSEKGGYEVFHEIGVVQDDNLKEIKKKFLEINSAGVIESVVELGDIGSMLDGL